MKHIQMLVEYATNTTPEKGAKFTQSWLMEVMARCSSSPMANRQIQIMV